MGEGRLTLVKIHELLERSGTAVPYRTLARFAAGECGYSSSSRQQVTVRVADGKPGEEVQLDFGYLGMISDGDRRRRLHALVFTAVLSRYCFVYLTFSQTTAAVIAGCEAAWSFFGGMFPVLVPENVPRNIFRVLCPASLCGRMAACPASTVIDGAWRRHGRRITPSSLQEAHSGACGGRRRGDAGGLLRQASRRSTGSGRRGSARRSSITSSWLAEHGYRLPVVWRRVPLLVAFGEFARRPRRPAAGWICPVMSMGLSPSGSRSP